MSARYQEYRQILSSTQIDIIAYLLDNSNLPGPRSNLELLNAFASIADDRLCLQCLAMDEGKIADGNTPNDFVVCCGIVGLGNSVNSRSEPVLEFLQTYASDHRWRIREAVAMAYQTWGRREYEAMIDYLSKWNALNPYEMRAAVAALCEPDLLRSESAVERVIGVLDRITGEFAELYRKRVDGWDVLEKGLSYGWSVAVAALPSLGKARMAYWLRFPDERIHRIMKNNLRKKRLLRMDPDWVKEMAAI